MAEATEAGPDHPTAAKVRERLRELGVDADVRALPDSTRPAAEAAACGCELGHDRSLRTIADESLRRFERVWCAAGTPHAVFELETETLVRAVGAA